MKTLPLLRKENKLRKCCFWIGSLCSWLERIIRRLVSGSLMICSKTCCTFSMLSRWPGCSICMRRAWRRHSILLRLVPLIIANNSLRYIQGPYIANRATNLDSSNGKWKALRYRRRTCSYCEWRKVPSIIRFTLAKWRTRNGCSIKNEWLIQIIRKRRSFYAIMASI